VQISHVAELIGLPQAIVERKLSQMILDQQLTGILDQGRGCLSLFELAAADTTYEAALATIQQSGAVVDALYKRAQKIC
jgi:26S proteasome regulatory subunit N6